MHDYIPNSLRISIRCMRSNVVCVCVCAGYVGTITKLHMEHALLAVSDQTEISQFSTEISQFSTEISQFETDISQFETDISQLPLIHPFATACSPLSCSGNPGVFTGVNSLSILQGWVGPRETLGPDRRGQARALREAVCVGFGGARGAVRGRNHALDA